MTAFQFYKTLGEQQVTPKQKYISATNTNTVVWTPTTSMRIAVTHLSISTNPGGTIQFWFGGANQIRLAEFEMAASSTIFPVIGSWESTATDAPLFAVASQNGTGNGWSITAEGFELIP